MSKTRKAIKHLISTNPFYGFYLLSLNIVTNNKFPTYGAIGYNKMTGGVTMYFNEKLIETLTFDETLGLLVHELKMVRLLV